MRTLNTFTRYKFNNIRNRLATLQLKYNLPDPARQIIQNEIEAAAQGLRSIGGKAGLNSLYYEIRIHFRCRFRSRTQGSEEKI
jgi:hypothetical protein